MEGFGAFSSGKVMMKQVSGKWCRDELEERVLEMMSEGLGFLWKPKRKATSKESEEASRAACGEW